MFGVQIKILGPKDSEGGHVNSPKWLEIKGAISAPKEAKIQIKDTLLPTGFLSVDERRGYVPNPPENLYKIPQVEGTIPGVLGIWEDTYDGFWVGPPTHPCTKVLLD